VPYGLYDLERVAPPLELDLGRAGEAYAGIRKEELNMAGKIVLRDARGAVGNPSADSARAAVGDSTVELLQLIYFHPGDERRREIVAETAALYERFFAARAESDFV
jgi:DNA/RNA-binding domain of Phe-tRNA-synthetase-like protein